MSEVEENADYVQELVDNLVQKCCGNLDKYLEYVNKILGNSDYALTNDELDDIIITIPSILYYVGDQQEKLGIKRDVSESTRSLLYNKIYLETTGTAGARKAAADQQLFNESLVSIVYNGAYEAIKAKTSIALEVLQSAKKIMTRRIAEVDLSKSAPNRLLVE